MWDVERLRLLAERHQGVVDEREFERRRRARMDEREAKARLYRPTGNVIPLGSRARVYRLPGDDAA